MAADAPAALLVSALVHNLADLVSGEAVFALPGPDGLTAAASWPARAAAGARLGADLAEVADLPGVAAVEAVPGGGAVLIAKPGRVTGSDSAALRQTAAWLGLAARLERTRAARDLAARRAAGLDADLAAARERLAQVRDLERRRLVGSITAVTTREFADVRARAGELRSAVDGEVDTAAAARAVEGVRDALDELIDTFRAVVRDVHPAMLPERGPRAALEELAATLPRPVRFTGTFGGRVGWEVESGLYHAAAAVLGLIASGSAPTPVSVDLARADGVLRVVATTARTRRAADLAAALADDTERLTVLGGSLTCAESGGDTVITVLLPERLSPPAAAADTRAVLLEGIRDLLAQGWQSARDEAERARWTAAADRLGRPLRLAVVGAARAPVVGALLGVEVPEAAQPTWYAYGEPGTGAARDGRAIVRLPADALNGLTIVDMPGAPDAALAEALCAPVEDSAPAVDAVLCLSRPLPGFRAALRASPHRVAVLQPNTTLRPRLALVAATLRADEFRALRLGDPMSPGLERVPPTERPTAIAVARGVAEQEPAALAAALATQSGLTALRRTITDDLLNRADLITARRALTAVDTAVRALPADHPLRWSAERLRLEAHDITELDLLDDLDRTTFPTHDDWTALTRLIGAKGPDPRTRLGLPPSTPDDQVHAAATAAADRWRTLAAHPATGPRARHACEIAIRTCEGLGRA
ncbi:hypothetical protein ACOBQX_03965 [Actinokineospora sp. G85]|uniref:hypothetical protein n=1 Tax=Actinokineospora sp. G85 TaxID=3406626 RepID=UPI003C762771